MTTGERDLKNPKTYEDAMARIDELEKGMDDAINTLLKRDDQLTVAERRIHELEAALESKGS